MNYIFAIVILVILIAIYLLGYYLNSKVNEPEGCKNLECEECVFKCHKRSE